MKKIGILVFILAVVLALGVLAACDGGGGGGDPSASSPSSTQKVYPEGHLLYDDGSPKTIKMCTWWGGKVFSTLRTVVAQFMEENPHITVEMLLWAYGADYDQKLIVASSGGDQPDIIMLNQDTQFARMWYGHILEPLNDYLDAMEFDTDRWLPGVKESHTYDGNIVAMPLHREQHVTWYNVDLFREAGLAPLPDQPTWDDIENAARTISAMGTNSDGDKVFGVRIHLNYSNAMDIYLNDMGFPIVGDADSAAFNTPERIAAAERIFNMVINYGPATGLTFEPMVTGVLGMDIGQPSGFVNESAEACDFETRMVNFPVNDASKGQIVAVSCNSLSMGASSKYKGAVALLMAKLSSPESEEMLKAYVLTPSAGSVYDELLTPKEKFPYDGFAVINPGPDARFSTLPKYDWVSRVSAQFEAVVNGDMTVQEYFAEGQRNVDVFLSNPDRDVLALE